MRINDLKDKKILILGLGKEGRDTLKFLRKVFPQKILGVGDREKKVKNQISNIKNIKWHLGDNYLKAIKKYDIIIKSPGIPIHLPEIEQAFKEGKITSQTEIFLENYPGRVIGITGTKGKSTTAALIYKILKEEKQERKYRVHLMGNIGKPVLSLLFRAKPNDIYIYELSSHQLYKIRKSPHIAVFLNIFPEHLDYYKDFKEYIAAKVNIVRFQNKEDFLIFNPKNKIVKEIAKNSKAKKIPIIFKKEEIEKIIKIKEIPLLGKFNLQNIAAAIAVGKILGVSSQKMRKAIKNFKPLPHRLEFIGTFHKITFYNDSLSTIPESTIAAIDTLSNKIETLITGGFDRGVNFRELAKNILKNKIKNVILFPTTGSRIWQEIVKYRKRYSTKPIPFFTDNMREAVKLSYEHTKKGKICLLSCASPSFGLFKNYKMRGNLFKRYVREFSKKI